MKRLVTMPMKVAIEEHRKEKAHPELPSKIGGSSKKSEKEQRVEPPCEEKTRRSGVFHYR